MKANRPWKSSPRVKPGSVGDRLVSPRLGVDDAERARARLEQPELAGVPAGRMRHRQPARDRFAAGDVDQHPAARLVRPPAGRGVGRAQAPWRSAAGPRPSPRPFRWQRSSGVSADTNGGRQRETKLWLRSSVQRHENRVLTNHSSSPAQAISWIWTLPVTWHERGRKQASCRPAGGSLRRPPGRCGTPRPGSGAEGQPIARQRQAHRAREGAEMRVEVVAVGPDDHQLARLVGGDEERNAEPPH